MSSDVPAIYTCLGMSAYPPSCKTKVIYSSKVVYLYMLRANVGLVSGIPQGDVLKQTKTVMIVPMNMATWFAQSPPAVCV